MVGLASKLGLVAACSSCQLEIDSGGHDHVKRVGEPVIVLAHVVRIVDRTPGLSQIGVDVEFDGIEHKSETKPATDAVVKAPVRLQK